MPSFKISPSSALMTSGQAVTFEATDDKGSAVSVVWNLAQAVGSLVPVPQLAPIPGQPAQVQPSFSATYIAPDTVQTAQTVVVTATSDTDVRSATIALTPDAISIVPATVELSAKEKQKFDVIVASGLDEDITWVLAPQVGTLDQTGMYDAPDPVPDDMTVKVTAIAKKLGQQVSANISLKQGPWVGPSVAILAGYILSIFFVVCFMIGLWPSQIQNIDTLKTNEAQAQSDLTKIESALQNALRQSPTEKPQTQSCPAPQTTGRQSPAAQAAAAKCDKPTNSPNESLLQQLTAEDQSDFAKEQDAASALKAATSPKLDTRLIRQINREIDFLYLILLAGALGAFLHIAPSFSDFYGNRALKRSWIWWYFFRPFVGAGLALVLYAALRGGLITLAATPAIKATDLNPYGLVAAAALAGLFSKAATTKLGEVFETIFQTSKGPQTKDPLKPDAQNNKPPANPMGSGSAPAPKATM